MPNCTEEIGAEKIDFGRVGRRVVEGRFDGGSMTGLRQGAAGLQRFDFGRRRFGPEGRIDGAVGPRDRL